jgi:UDP-3-O-[3-hydroxymyristoyl] glucosamine N-acyltransferase
MRRLVELAELIDGQVFGNPDLKISGAGILSKATSEQITFAADQKYFDTFLASNADAAIVGPDVEIGTESANVIVANNPEAAFAKIVAVFRPPIERAKTGISPQAIVSPSAMIADDVTVCPGAVIMDRVKIGCGTVIYPNVTVMEDCQIGANTTVYPNTTLYENTIVGDRVIIHAGVVLGAYGFGYKSGSGQHQLSAQLGNVVIGNDVELGANTTIDRGTYDSTTIGDGTKLDNMVMIGHNCSIGEHNLLCSQVGIAGSSTTGDFVVMGGQVGVGDHLEIGSNVQVGAKSGLMHNIEADQKIFGIPTRPAREQMQIIAATIKLPALRKEFKSAMRRINELEKTQSSNTEEAIDEAETSESLKIAESPAENSDRRDAA